MRTRVNGPRDQSAHYAADVRDTVVDVTSKNVDPRGVRIPLPPGHWWPPAAMEAANARADQLKIRRPGYRSITQELIGWGVEADEDKVRRCITGEIVTWDLALPISKLLGIRPPAMITMSADDGALLDSTADELEDLLAKLRGAGPKRQG